MFYAIVTQYDGERNWTSDQHSTREAARKAGVTTCHECNDLKPRPMNFQEEGLGEVARVDLGDGVVVEIWVIESDMETETPDD